MPDQVLAVATEDTKTTFIYALCDPDTQMVRYVGKANNPKRRFYGHLYDKDRTYKVNWIKSLKASGKIPILKILEEVPLKSWEESERKWVSYYRNMGVKLTNNTNGGDSGTIVSEETKKKHSINSRRTWNNNPEYRKKMTEILNKARSLRNEETFRKMSIAIKKNYQEHPELKKIQGRPDIRKRQSETSKKVWTEEVRRHHSEILRKTWTNPKLRINQSNIAKKMWADPKHRKNVSGIIKNIFRNPSEKLRRSIESKKRWEDPHLKEKMIKALRWGKFKKIIYRLMGQGKIC